MGKGGRKSTPEGAMHGSATGESVATPTNAADLANGVHPTKKTPVNETAPMTEEDEDEDDGLFTLRSDKRFWVVLLVLAGFVWYGASRMLRHLLDIDLGWAQLSPFVRCVVLCSTP